MRIRYALRVVLGSTVFALVAPDGSTAQIDLARAVPVDPVVTMGELDNGLRYYIRPNNRPANRAELRLVVNVGSVLEEETQLGLAHLLEHMAFNGTEHFERQELVDYLESIGMRFGPSVNASTSFDETIYILQVPTEDPDVLDTSFQILEDWAQGMSLDPGEIDQERGVVIEEWRLGQGSGARLRDQQFPIMFSGSRYADRLPIGTVEVLESFPPEELVRFYDDWYRPDLMAVVAVGDFERSEVEAMVREHFGRIPARPDAPPRPSFGVPDIPGTRFAIASDPEVPGSSVGLVTLQDPPPTGTIADLRRSLIEGLASSLLNDRLRELTQRPDAPFLGAGSSRGRFVRSKSGYQLTAAVSENGHRRGLEAILTEAERAARHGFTPSELEREKVGRLRNIELAYAERENRPSGGFVGAYVNHFLYGSPIPSLEFQVEVTRELLAGITVEELNEVAVSNLAPEDRVVLVTAIDKPEVTIPTEDDLLGVFASVERAEIAPYEDAAPDQPLVASLPSPGAIVGDEVMEAVDVTVWHLSNGAEVWLKVTDFRDDEILFGATSPGGWSRSSLEDHLTAQNAASVARLGGLGEFSVLDLQKVLTGKAASASAAIAETRESLSGGASPQDLETLFQLIWLNFTAPRKDETVFQAFIEQGKAALANRGASPGAAFGDTLTLILTQHHPRTLPTTAERLDEIDLDRALDFYRDRFASADDFTFIFVGAIDSTAFRPLVEQYLASLPSLEREDGWVDLDIDPPSGVVEKTVRKGIEPQSQTVIAFTGPFDYTDQNRMDLRALAETLQLRLRERLREDLGGTYSVGVNASYDHEPETRYTVLVQFGSDPERAEELRATVFEEIERMKTEGPSAEDVGKFLESERRSKETALEQNGWWRTQLRYVAETGSDGAHLVSDDRLGNVDEQSIRDDAQLYLRNDRYVMVVLLPEVPIGDR